MTAATWAPVRTDMLTAGEWTSAARGHTRGVVNSPTEQEIAQVAWGDRTDAARALAAAGRALPDWSARTAYERAEGLQFGIIGLNDTVPATAEAPCGGLKESGYGREGASEGLDSYLETKYVSLALDQ